MGAGPSAGTYYTHDSAREAKPSRRDEYYAQDGDGRWWSTGQTVVRHGAHIDVETFRDLCAGVDPRTGRALVRGAGAGHWAGLDMTLTPGKSVSILWMAGTAEQRALIEAAHAKAVERALQFVVDERLVVVRQGAGGVEKHTPTDLIVARFTHFTTREGDPNIHDHCVFMNVAGAPLGGGGRYSYRHLTIDPEKLFAWQLVVGGAYRSALAETLAETGLTPRPAGRNQWELAGIPQEVIESFSKRSHQIEAAVGRNATGAQKEIATLRTRGSKEDVPTGEELENRWRSELAQTGTDPWRDTLESGLAGGVVAERAAEREREAVIDAPELDGVDAVARAASKLLRHESVIERRALLEAALAEAALDRLGPDGVYAQIAAHESAGRLAVLAPGKWTTPSIAACEAALLRAAERPQERAWIPQEALEAALARASHLSPEQREAVVSAASHDGVSVIEAGAGTGKTTLAHAVVDTAHGANLRVIGLAPSWVAADELTRSTGVESVAIAKWRHDRQSGKAPSLTSDTLIVMDEAGMAGTRDMEAVLTAAKDAGAKVVLVGDRRQLESVAGASALKAVREVVQRGAVLSAVRRQTVEWQRAASVLMARGDVEAGLRAYAAQDRVELAPGPEAARAKAIELWTQLRERHGQNVLMVTRRNSDSLDLNLAARQRLKAEGRLRESESALPSLDRDDKPCILPLAVGDLVRFSENLPNLTIRNGDRATIARIVDGPTPGDTHVTFELESGRKVEGPWASFARQRPGKKAQLPPRIVHAYAGTVYSAQGRTAAASVLHIANATDAREVYVGLTRHTQDVHVVVESDRLDAQCRQRQADHRNKPTTVDMLDRLFREARHYREKANVVDHVADRAAFVRSGEIVLPDVDPPDLSIRRAIEGARALRETIARLDPARLLVPAWRLVEQGRNLMRDLPPQLAQLLGALRERIDRTRGINRGHGYDR